MCIFQDTTSSFSRCSVFPKNGQEASLYNNFFWWWWHEWGQSLLSTITFFTNPVILPKKDAILICAPNVSSKSLLLLTDAFLLFASGRLSCCIKLCSSSRSSSCIHLPKQWMGNQYPIFRTIQKYSAYLISLYAYLLLKMTLLEGHSNLIVYLFPIFWKIRGDCVVVRGQGYGIRSIRVEGNDALAMYFAVSKAR